MKWAYVYNYKVMAVHEATNTNSRRLQKVVTTPLLKQKGFKASKTLSNKEPKMK